MATASASVRNNAGGTAYAHGPEHALAQLAVTGCFNNTYYVSGASQLDKVLELAKQCDPEYVAKLALYARQKGMMKDMPAFLTAYLSTVSSELLLDVFPSVINNGKMLRNFVQIMRSGAVGRKSLGTAPKRLVRAWFDTRSPETVLFNSVGNDPSLADVIKMVHPKPSTPQKAALYAYFIGKEYETKDLPEGLQLYLQFKGNASTWENALPEVPFELLTGEQLSLTGWKMLAEQATWNQTRQALNTFHRHDVFKDTGMVKLIADKLRDPEQVRKWKAFPYQLMMTFVNISPEIPREIAKALENAMEVATENIPVLDGDVYICPDVSGSMGSPVSGDRVGKSGKPTPPSKVRCIDVAALVAASVLRTNPHAVVLPFDGKVRDDVKLNPKSSVLTNAQILAKVPGGSTACSAPLKRINDQKGNINSILYVSDYESWRDGYDGYGHLGTATTMSAEWNKARNRCPNAKLICIDVTPNDTTQVNNRGDSLNVGGFSDDVFKVVSNFISGSGQQWVDQIRATPL